MQLYISLKANMTDVNHLVSDGFDTPPAAAAQQAGNGNWGTGFDRLNRHRFRQAQPALVSTRRLRRLLNRQGRKFGLGLRYLIFATTILKTACLRYSQTCPRSIALTLGKYRKNC
jgi:hypothetical protein